MIDKRRVQCVEQDVTEPRDVAFCQIALTLVKVFIILQLNNFNNFLKIINFYRVILSVLVSSFICCFWLLVLD